MKNNTKKLALCGVMTALSVVLSFIKIYELPYGGAITLFSMVPVMFVGYVYGAKWGLAAGAVHGVIQCIAGASNSLAYLTDNTLNFILCLLFDYIVAFAVLGLAGVFKNKIKKPAASFALGVVFAGFLRFLCHFITGWIVWGSYAEETLLGSGTKLGEHIVANFTGNALAVVYSLVYNASYMLPEIIISVVIAVVLISVTPIRKAAFSD
ncbi:MAG: energy-coupled thiamine transporter ThiT [Clostridia bacterium]|nr:energy-coupled thiamine transporter ThiT [Clostridia bacterium]